MEAGLRQDYREVTPVKPNVYRVTDDEGNVTQITFDPYTMEETGRVNLGKIGKGKAVEEEIESFFKDADYKYFAGMEVPKEAADAISIAIQEGRSLDEIRQGLKAVYDPIKGEGTGFGYLDIVYPYIKDRYGEA